MPGQFIHYAYPSLILILSLFFIFRIGVGRKRRASGAGYIYAGLIIAFLFSLINLLQEFPGYDDWFLEGIYPVIVIVKFITLAAGLILFIIGMAFHFSDWKDRLELSDRHLTKLKLLERIQYECRRPFQTVELLDRVLGLLQDGLEENSGAVYLYSPERKEFDLVSSAGFSEDEMALLKHYPLGSNIISGAIENRRSLITADFRSFGGKAQVALSKFKSMAVFPLVSGKSRLGALLFFSNDASRYDDSFIDLVKPISGWLSERLEVLRLGRDFQRTVVKVEQIENETDHYLRKLAKITETVRDTVTPSEYASVVRELVDVDDVHLIGLVQDRLHIYGGTTDRIDFSEKFKGALENALSKGRTVVLNQEETAEDGQLHIAGASLVLPLGSRDDALLLRRRNDSISFTEREMESLRIAATLGGMIISFEREKEIASARGDAFAAIADTLRINHSDHSPKEMLSEFLDRVSDKISSDTIMILFRRDGEYLKALHANIDIADLSDLEIELGESSTGRAAAVKSPEYAFGTTAVSQNLGHFHAQNKVHFRNLFGSERLPLFMGDYPLLTDNRTEFLFTVFQFSTGALRGKERHQFYAIITGLINIKLSLISQGERVNRNENERDTGKKETTEELQVKSSHPQYRPPRRILVVADQPVILELITAMCRELGYEIIAASNPSEGYGKFEGKSPSAVLVDMSTSSARELETTDLARQSLSIWEMIERIHGANPDLPIIAMTGAGKKLQKERFQSSGVRGILYKPFQISQLAEILDRAGIS